MPKALSIIALIVGIVLLVLFGVDLAIKIPFRWASVGFDVGIIISAAIIIVLSWLTLREQQ